MTHRLALAVAVLCLCSAFPAAAQDDTAAGSSAVAPAPLAPGEAITGATAAGGAALAAPPAAEAVNVASNVRALVAAQHVLCAVSNARLVGMHVADDGVRTHYYEVACQEGLGYILADTIGHAETAGDCVMMAVAQPDGKPFWLSCKLPENASPATGLNSVMTTAGRSCSVDRARWIGQTIAQGYYEVACQNGNDYVLQWKSLSGRAPVATNCLAFDLASGQIHCNLITRDQQLQVVNQLVVSIPTPCTVTNRRYIGSTAGQNDLFEVSCGGGAGYILETYPSGQLMHAFACSGASNVAGGCQLPANKLQ